MNVVYEICFTERKSKDIRPHTYIGSKSNCTFDGTNILDKNGKVYLGSSKFPGYKDLFLSEKYEVKILSNFETYSKCIEFEKELHTMLDIAANDKYFNLAIASASTFADPNYGTFRHSTLNFFVKLPKNHPLVVEGVYVNSNDGYKTYNNGDIEKQFRADEIIPDGWTHGRLAKNILSGEKNGFSGKHHTDETLSKIVKSRKQTYEKDPEKYRKICDAAAERTRNVFKGVKKSKESNEKRSRKNLVVLKNVLTGECVRIHKDLAKTYDTDVWKNPSS